MKNLKIFFILVVSLGLIYACNSNEEVSPAITNEASLIQSIQSADLLAAQVSDLPAQAVGEIEENYADSYVASVSIAPSLGYAVMMRVSEGSQVGTRTDLYFDLEGRVLTEENEGALRAGIDRRGAGRIGEGRQGRKERDCFELEFPITFILPDASIITLESEEDWQLIRDWYAANPDSEDKPALVFPVNVTLADGSSQSIENEETLDSLRSTCEGNFERGHGDKREGDKGFCFEIVFPYTLIFSDSSTITLNSKEDLQLVRDWYEANPDVRERPELLFPIEINYGDTLRVTINNEEELNEARANCKNYQRGARGESEERGARRDREPCFQLVFPYAFTMPDSSIITINSQEDGQLIRDWYAANPRTQERPTLNFPVDIIFEDGSTQTINTEEEFDTTREACREDERGDNGNEDE